MIIPENMGVIVIDDDLSEATPLLNALYMNGIPVIYFTGQEESDKKLIKNYLCGIRVIFLDLFLVPEVQSPEYQISNGINVLQNIISKGNGMFLIIAWTKHSDLMKSQDEFFKAKLKEAEFNTILLSLEKRSCQKPDLDEEGKPIYDMDIISDKVREKLQEVGAFHLFMIWEDIIRKSSSKIVNDFSGFHEFDENWNKNMVDVFMKLAEGFSGKHLARLDDKEKIKSALFSFNSAFMDTLESEIRNYNTENFNISFSYPPTNIDDNIIGCINTKLLLEMNNNLTIPGNIYDYSGIETDIKKVKPSDLFDPDYYKENKKQIKSEVEYIILEISPLCDYTQKKWETCRILPGLLIPQVYEEQIRERTDYIYKSKLIKFEEKPCCLVFDFRFFASIEPDKLKDKSPKFRLRYQLLVDIQSKLASHINRPGVMLVENPRKEYNKRDS
jgi:hypothetical protein